MPNPVKIPAIVKPTRVEQDADKFPVLDLKKIKEHITIMKKQPGIPQANIKQLKMTKGRNAPKPSPEEKP